MPIYEYQCPKCGNIFEEWAKASESHKEEPCPQCGALSPRIISRTSFVLKGDGWYVSDYGYRKGITEDGGAGAAVPAPGKPTTPATQGEKALATTDAAPKAAAAPKTEGSPKAKAGAGPARAKGGKAAKASAKGGGDSK